MRADLHTHTTASDGSLSPAELVEAAAASGIERLAITDHDTVNGLAALAGQALPPGLTLIAGIELSANWENVGIHVVGLQVDPDNAQLRAGIARQLQARVERAAVIAERLEKAGFTGVLEGAQRVAAGKPIGRPHFARYLVESKQIRDIRSAFRRHLGRGQRGDVRQVWPPLPEVTGWIIAAGGVPVLAHPAKYKLTNRRLEALCRDFIGAGGLALEVISGSQNPALTDKLARLANRYGLLASAGSDFHSPGQPWAQLGAVATLPPDCRPVWQNW